MISPRNITTVVFEKDRSFNIPVGNDESIEKLICALNTFLSDESSYFKTDKKNRILEILGSSSSFDVGYQKYYELKYFEIFIHPQQDFMKEKVLKIRVCKGTNEMGLKHAIKHALSL